MSKIRDDVDLKELEKYGFEYEELNNCYRKDLDPNSNWSDIDEIIIEKDRKIYSYTLLETDDDAYGGYCKIDEYLSYKIDDLVKDGLVIKEEE